MKKTIIILLLTILAFGCQKSLSTSEMEKKLDSMAYKAFAKEEYKSLGSGSYIIKLSDLLKYTNTEDIFINPKTKDCCDKTASMAILDIKEENGVLKRTISTILVCD